jgi:conjugal transfer mating pair stabilization protein TraG
MEFAIYTYGGGEVYWKVFNGIALLFKHENQFMTLLIKLCMTFGVIAAGFVAILRQNISQFIQGWLLPSFIITSLLIFPETQVHIIDEIDLDHKYSKVDHVPVGLAAAVSLTSMISKGMVETIEDSLGVDESLQYSKVGPMFAAKLVAMSRDVQIKDPIMRENIKDFMRQCFMWPYVFTNIAPGRKAALESQDIFKFITSNPHPSLGTYWRNPEGTTEFVYCGQCTKRVKEVLDIEKPRGLQSLAQSLIEGNEGNDGEQATRKLKRYFGHAWEALAHQTSEAHEIVGQQMLINAYREGLDDKREEFGLDRINPHLIAYSASRANEQQNTTFLTYAQNAGRSLPTTQPIFVAFCCFWFLFIACLAVLPGGVKRLITWFNVLLSFQLWPVFSAILNFIALSNASKAGAKAVMGVGGLSILTQNGLADAAYDAWCYTEGLQASIPLISYAVISGSGYALTNLFTSPLQAVQSAAARMGAEAVDGNLSFDQQSFHNRSVASTQVAQQQFSPNIGFGSRIDDGKMAITHGVHGETTFAENLSSLQNNVSANDNIALTASENSQRSLQAAHSHGTSSMNAAHDTVNWMKSFGDSLHKTQGLNEGYGNTKTAQLVKDASESRDHLLQLKDSVKLGHPLLNMRLRIKLLLVINMQNKRPSTCKGLTRR